MATYLEQRNNISVEKLDKNTVQKMRDIVTIKKIITVSPLRKFLYVALTANFIQKNKVVSKSIW